MSRFTRLAGFAVIAISMSTMSGCAVNALWRNMWVGFGESIGALPGNIVASSVAGLFGVSS